MKTVFICVNYNNSRVTIDYILNVTAIKKEYDVKIIVVDNASEDSDVQDLDSYIVGLKNENVILLKSDSNLGYFKGLNLGIKWALLNGYNQYQIVGNNDLEFFPDFLNNLEHLELKKNELILSPDIITMDGIHENPHVIQRMSFLKLTI